VENFTLTGASGWQLLSTLLVADATFKGIYMWSMMSIKNTHTTQTMIVKALPGTTAPSVDSGTNLAAGISFTWDCGNQGSIDGKSIWIKCSGASTTFDLTFLRKLGV